MNRMILCAVLTLISVQAKLYAQKEAPAWVEKRDAQTRTDRTFTMTERANIRDFVWLLNGKIILEMKNVDDFDRLKNLDAILSGLKKDIEFYKDSLGSSNNASIRIDYVVEDSAEYRQMRFTRHATDGDLYVNKHGETSRLKIEQDTVRLIMHIKEKARERMVKRKGEEKRKISWTPQHTIQVTFCLNNYTDIDKLIANPEFLSHAVDTLQSTKKEKTKSNPFKFPSSSRYTPYAKYTHFTNFNGLAKKDENTPWNTSNRADNLAINVNLGAGLVMNTLAPYGESGLSLTTRSRYNDENYFNCFRAFVSFYFFFDKSPSGGFLIRDNWFVNADVGAPDNLGDVKTRLLSWGVGYLVKQKGDYFKSTTMKVFLNIQLKHSITLCPEIISTNNFKQFYPGITFKIFD